MIYNCDIVISINDIMNCELWCYDWWILSCYDMIWFTIIMFCNLTHRLYLKISFSSLNFFELLCYNILFHHKRLLKDFVKNSGVSARGPYFIRTHVWEEKRAWKLTCNMGSKYWESRTGHLGGYTSKRQSSWKSWSKERRKKTWG